MATNLTVGTVPKAMTSTEADDQNERSDPSHYRSPETLDDVQGLLVSGGPKGEQDGYGIERYRYVRAANSGKISSSLTCEQVLALPVAVEVGNSGPG